MPVPLLGIFVGGRSSRMGGRPKGRLPAPSSGEPIVQMLVRIGREAGLEPVLVGEAAGYEDLAAGVERLEDDPPGVGPLGGLAALLGRAGMAPAVAVACDMPRVTALLLRRLVDHPATAPVLAPRRGWDAPWEPLLARYDAPRVRPVLHDVLGRGHRSFQRLFAHLEVAELAMDPAVAAALADWDTPRDIE